jgi:hypothetical protein
VSFRISRLLYQHEDQVMGHEGDDEDGRKRRKEAEDREADSPGGASKGTVAS